jgi:hypothetical protein
VLARGYDDVDMQPFVDIGGLCSAPRANGVCPHSDTMDIRVRWVIRRQGNAGAAPRWIHSAGELEPSPDGYMQASSVHLSSQLYEKGRDLAHQVVHCLMRPSGQDSYSTASFMDKRTDRGSLVVITQIYLPGFSEVSGLPSPSATGVPSALVCNKRFFPTWNKWARFRPKEVMPSQFRISISVRCFDAACLRFRKACRGEQVGLRL